MANSKESKPANKEVKFENMKKLNAVLSSDSDFSALLNNIKAIKGRTDSLLSLERQKEQSIKEVRKAEKEETAPREVRKREVEMPILDAEPKVKAPKFVEKEAVKKHPETTTTEQPKKKEEPPKKMEKTDKAVPDFIVTRKYEVKTPSFVKGVLNVEERAALNRNIRTGQAGKTGAPQRPDNRRPDGKPQRPPFGTGTDRRQDRPPFASGDRKPFGTGARQDRPPFIAGGERKPFERKPGGLSSPMKPRMPIVAPQTPIKDRKGEKKKDFAKQHDDKKTMNKRTLIRKGFITDDMDEGRMGTRKLKNKKKEAVRFIPAGVEKAIITTENLTVKILSEKIGKTAQQIIKQLMVLGIMTTINSVVDFPTMELVANELGVAIELKLDKSKESLLEDYFESKEIDESALVKRPPVITVMGHVDHGKTSLLDTIRKTAVAEGEAGGITQQIGAYSVNVNGEKITFLDTPGHEAFAAMRERGAKVTDIAILVVAADDGIMPQTIEAITHAKAAGVPIIVAINKIDKPGANPEKIRQALTEYGLVAEEWGGDTIMVPISAKRGDGIDKLLEMILFLAEYNNYRANSSRKARGFVLEARLDKGKGPIANMIVQSGVLRVGDFIVSGMTYGRVRAMVDDKGRNIKEAGASVPVSVLGLTDVPAAGDAVYSVEDEKTARQLIDERTNKIKNQQISDGPKLSFDDAFSKLSDDNLKELNIVLKADGQGHVEALKTALLKLSNEKVKVNVVFSGVGNINKSDMMFADISKAMVIGFNVRPDSESKAIGEQLGIDIKLYKIIYEALDAVERAMKELYDPRYKETLLGKAQVRNIIKIPGLGFIAGSYVLNGKIIRNQKARIHRGKEVIFEGTISGLKRFKDDVKEVTTGYECGISVQGFDGFIENDEIECYSVEVIRE